MDRSGSVVELSAIGAVGDAFVADFAVAVVFCTLFATHIPSVVLYCVLVKPVVVCLLTQS